MVAGVASGSGKTTMTCALLTKLVRCGLKTASFKCGPDYIDPMFHSRVIGAKSRNLDLFLSDESVVRRLLAQNAAGHDIAVIEGVMGYYDGLAGKSTQASSYHLAQVTNTPVVLAVDCMGMSVSVAAIIGGLLQYRESGIRGVILNRVTAGLYAELKELIEKETGVRVYGYLPNIEQAALQSRHLGLVTAHEVKDLKQKLDDLADAFEKTVDVEALLGLSREAVPIDYEMQAFPKLDVPVKVAVAQDEAFCFYYQDSLDVLKEMGLELVPFSPLTDTALPKGIAGMIIGGGYPELYAKQLSNNTAMRADCREKLTGGLPCIGECGGFMYLQQSMQDENGMAHPMVGVLEGDCYNRKKLARFGYIDLTANKDGLLHKAGQTTRAHEFHYWVSNKPGDGYAAQKPLRNKEWDCVQTTDTLWAGYPHLYLAADTNAAWRFAQACAAYTNPY